MHSFIHLFFHSFIHSFINLVKSPCSPGKSNSKEDIDSWWACDVANGVVSGVRLKKMKRLKLVAWLTWLRCLTYLIRLFIWTVWLFLVSLDFGVLLVLQSNLSYFLTCPTMLLVLVVLLVLLQWWLGGFTYLYFCIFVFLYFCIFVFLYFCIFVFLYFCIFIFLYFCIFVFLYFCISLLVLHVLLVIHVQWTPLNGIMDNGINRLMGSNLSYLTSPKFCLPT